MQMSSRNPNPDTPIDLSQMGYEDVFAYFECCEAALIERTDLRPETIDKVFDAEFRSDFEQAPRKLLESWRAQQTIWTQIHNALDKADRLAKTLSPLEQQFYDTCLEHVSKAKVGSDEAAKQAAEFASWVSRGNGNPQADVVARAVAAAFEIEGRRITFGRKPSSREPSTDFGRTVQIAIEIFRPEGNDGKVADWTAPAQNAVKLVKRG